jgi:hypothetical protein
MKSYKDCAQCGKTFNRPANLTGHSKWASRLYCGRNCWFLASRKDILDQPSKACVQCLKVFYRPVGVKAISLKRWKERRVCSNACWRALYLSSSNRPNQHRPTPTSKEYRTIHQWVSRHFEEKKACAFCGDEKKGRNLHWANISSRYLRERSDWVCLCSLCHSFFDRPELLDREDYRGKILPHVEAKIREIRGINKPSPLG